MQCSNLNSIKFHGAAASYHSMQAKASQFHLNFASESSQHRIKQVYCLLLAASDRNWLNAQRDEPPALQAMVAAALCAATRALS